jgi:hypothetical protein
MESMSKSVVTTRYIWSWASLICIACGTVTGADGSKKVDYNYDIKPILSDRCYQCHGPDAEQLKADLRLDVDDGPHNPFASEIIQPGNPEGSPLWQRISSTDPAERMPPASAKLPPLADDEIERIRLWIEQGATWKPHWSFNSLTETVLPPVEDESWIRNSIDRFVLARLDALDVAPAPEADRETLIRRVTFDINGLPPTLEEIDDFLSDESPDAYQRVVDRLLQSKRFGEHLAVHWLDLSRYADSYGYQVDPDRRVWPWRDWVIRALNDNLPYDQFITWQLAGDLLPDPTDEQRLATAFNRLHPQKVEGGSIEEEFRVEYVADRTHTFATAMLGLTMECSRCHDHKFDPIAQRDYYSLFAFFNNIDESGLNDHHHRQSTVPPPKLLLADNDQKSQLADMQAAIVTSETGLADLQESRREAFHQWISERTNSEAPLVPDCLAHYSFDERVEGKLPNLVDAETPAETSTHNQIVAGRFGQAIRVTGDDTITISTGKFSRHDPFSVSLWLRPTQLKKRMVVFHRTEGWTDAASRGYELLLEAGRLSAALIHFWPGDAIRVRSRSPIPLDQWTHVVVTYDGSSRAPGLRIYRDGQTDDLEIVRDQLVKTILDDAKQVIIGARNRDTGFTQGLVDEFQIFERELTAIEVGHLHDGHSLADVLGKPLDEISKEERDRLFDYFLSTADDPYREHLSGLREQRQQRGAFIDEIPEIMVMKEMRNVRPTFVLERGAYDAPGQPVEPLTPAALFDWPANQPRNRIGLAAWLTDPHHPLTSRVAANRFWQLLFGVGLVRTPEDFGSQGELPTHPHLLDWLAKNFIDQGWNVKHFLKQVVMSATYRQSSRPRPDLELRDTENRWLARGPRQRLSAELIRDNVLATSGLLVEQIGGPPVRPYEVAVSFKPVNHDEGDGLYRRSLYTTWKRTGPPPMMMALDAVKRDVCVVRREQTSTPLQALVMLNSPQVVEAARVLGERLFDKYGDDTSQLLDEMFRTLTGRHPTSQQHELLLTMYDEQWKHFRDHPEQAEAFLNIGNAPHSDQLEAAHVAAAGAVASALFNFDACVMKR